MAKFKDKVQTLYPSYHNLSASQLTMTDGSRYTFESIVSENHPTHVELFMRGTAPRLADLAGWQFSGRNLSMVSWFLGVRRFIKGFQRGDQSSDSHTLDSIQGYNLWARQNNGLVEPWEPSSPNRHGFYKVSPVKPGDTESLHPHALILNYGLADNPWANPARFLRDYVVQVYPDDPGLLMGNAYIALGPFRILVGYFVLKKREYAG